MSANVVCVEAMVSDVPRYRTNDVKTGPPKKSSNSIMIGIIVVSQLEEDRKIRTFERSRLH